METTVKTANGNAWKIDFEAALALGVQRVAKMQAIDEEIRQRDAANLAQAWQEYDAEVRAGLPEVLRPLMVPLRDETTEPPYNCEEQVLLDLEPYGVAPMVAFVRMVSPGLWLANQYLVLGIWETTRGQQRYGFGDGDENWVVKPKFEADMTLALGLAHARFIRKLDLEAQARRMLAEELEYVPDSQETDLSLPEKALAVSVRAIVRDEMFKPPHA